MRFTFFDQGVAGKVLFEKDYSRQVHVKARTATALMAAWNQTLEQILEQLTADLLPLTQR